MTVRPASNDGPDLDLVWKLRIEFLADHRGIEPHDLPEEFVAETRSFLGRFGAAGRLHSWVDEDAAGTCRGVVTMLLNDGPPRPGDHRTGEGYVLNMYVRPEHRRQGVGQALFDACLAGADELDLRRVYLRATPDGRPMYAKAGFRENDEWMELVR